MEGDASVLKDEIEKIQDALGDEDVADEYGYDSDESDSQLYIDLGLSSRDQASTYRDASSTSGLTTYEGSVTDEDTRSQVYSVTDSTGTGGESNSTELPIDVETCLALNRAYQEIISEHLENIQTLLIENREKQHLLESNLDEGCRSKSVKDKPGMKIKTYMPYFKNEDGLAPPPNEDVKLKEILQEKKQEARLGANWSVYAQRKLINAVCKDSLQKLIQPLMNRREILENKRVKAATPKEKEEIIKKIDELDDEIQVKSKTRKEVLMKNVDDEKVDWMRIAKIDFYEKREWYDCQKIWKVVVNPDINKSEWSEEETAQLIELFQKYGTGQWEKIVGELGTNRTAFQAMQYYQTNLSLEQRQKQWSTEEDEKLIEAINLVRDVQAERIKFQRVSYLMEARSAEQCRKRWSQIDPDIRRLRWQPEEDVRLMLAVKLIGSKDWISVAKYVPHRNGPQCRERYCNYLDPRLQLGRPFTYQEDKQILALVKEHGRGNWAKIATFMEGRTDQNIAVRYKRLQQWKYTSQWYKQQPVGIQRLLQGLPLRSKTTNEKPKVNWELYRRDYGLRPDHYAEQLKDMEENGEDSAVPLPPLLQVPPKGCQAKSRVKFKERMAVSRHIDNILNCEDSLSSQERELRKKEILQKMESDNEVTYQSSVKNLLMSARKAVRENECLRRDKIRVRNKVLQDISKLVKGPNTSRKPKLTTGRPKKYFPDDDYMTDEEMKKLSVSILSLAATAMEVDGNQMIKQYEIQQRKSPRSVLQQKDIAMFKEVVLRDGSYSQEPEAPVSKQVVPEGGMRSKRRQSRTSHQITETTPEQGDVTMETQPTSAQSLTLSTSKPLSRSLSSVKSVLPRQSSLPPNFQTEHQTSSTSVLSRQPSLTSNIETERQTPSTTNIDKPSTSYSETTQTLHARSRKNNNGPKEDLPFLPPNLSNLKGFKSLLLSRQTLIKKAGNCYTMMKCLNEKQITNKTLNKTVLPSINRPEQVYKQYEQWKSQNNCSVNVTYVYPRTQIQCRKGEEAVGSTIHVPIENITRADIDKVNNGTASIDLQKPSGNINIPDKDVTELIQLQGEDSAYVNPQPQADRNMLIEGYLETIHGMMNQNQKHAVEKNTGPSTFDINTTVSEQSSSLSKTTLSEPDLENQNGKGKKRSNSVEEPSKNNKNNKVNQTGNSSENRAVADRDKNKITPVNSGEAESNSDLYIVNAEDNTVVCQLQCTSDALRTEKHVERTSRKVVKQPIPVLSTEEEIVLKLKNSHDYKMLKARFQSLFVWPAMLSSMYTASDGEADRDEPREQDKKKKQRNKTRRKYACSKAPGFYKYNVKTIEEKERIREKRLAEKSQAEGCSQDVDSMEDDSIMEVPPVNRKRGRPKMVAIAQDELSSLQPNEKESPEIKRMRGRPRKDGLIPSQVDNSSKANCLQGDYSLNESQQEDNSLIEGEDIPIKRKKGRPKGSKTKIPIVENKRHSSRSATLQPKSYVNTPPQSFQHCQSHDYSHPIKKPKGAKLKNAITELVTQARADLAYGLKNMDWKEMNSDYDD